MPRTSCLFATAIAALLTGTCFANGPTSQPSEQSDVLITPKLTIAPQAAPDSIDEELIDAAQRPAGILPYGPVSLFDPLWKQLNRSLDTIGLHVGLAYTTLFMAASNGPGTRTAAGQDIDLFGDWRLLGAKDSPNPGFLYFAAEYRGDLGTGIAPGGLGSKIGSLWGVTNGFGEQPLTVKELYWEQRIDTDRLILRIGKLDPENYYNSNYWQSDNKYFLNKAFSSFPVRAFPGQGLGLNLTAKIAEDWFISTGAQDAQGQKTRVGFDTLFGDFNLFSAFEVRYAPTIPNLGKGAYRLTAWYRDAGQTTGSRHDSGFDLSFDQHITENIIPFFRYGVGEGNINGIEHMISTGIGWEGKLLTELDAIGIAGTWGKPSNHSLNDQFAAELFYRLQVSPDNQFTVGYQAIVDPVNDPGSHAVGVFELRWRISF